MTTENKIKGSTVDHHDQALDAVFAELGTKCERRPTAIPTRCIVGRSEPRPPQNVPTTAARVSVTMERDRDTTDWGWTLTRAFFIGLIVLGVFFAYKGVLPSWKTNVVVSSMRPPARTASARLVTKPIEDVQVGERTMGRNTLREQVDWSMPEPDPKTWRKLRLHLVDDDGLSHWIDLLRPLVWIEATGAAVGSTIYLDLPEMGAVGDAEVTYLGACPEIRPGPGNVVTGKFTHESDGSNVVELRLEGEPKPTGVTDNHPYFSEDRQDYVGAGDLRPGEIVSTYYGTTRVISVTPIEYDDHLYNLETHREHVFMVGSLGTLVHNSCARVGHHPIPKFMGGHDRQWLSLPKKAIHTEFHQHLSASLAKRGLPPMGGATGSTQAWKRYMSGHAGGQRQAFDAILDATRAIDTKYGTNLTRDVWRNIMRGDFDPFL